MNRNRSIALPQDATVTRRGLLILLGAGTMLVWSAARALSESPLDANGAPILLPGQTPTPQTNARQREAVQQSQDRAIQNRAQQRTLEGQQQFQNNNAAAQQRDLNVQRNLDAQRLDILNNRDKP